MDEKKKGLHFWSHMTDYQSACQVAHKDIRKERLGKSPCILFATIHCLLVGPSRHKHHLLVYDLC